MKIFKLFGAEMAINTIPSSCSIAADDVTKQASVSLSTSSTKPSTTMVFKLFGTEISVNPFTATTAATSVTDKSSSSTDDVVSKQEEQEKGAILQSSVAKIDMAASSVFMKTSTTIPLNPRRRRHCPRPTSYRVNKRFQNDPPAWKIRKRLGESDVNGLSRLLVSRKLMEEEVLPLMEEEMRRKVQDEDCSGLSVEMVDDDTGIVHHNMTLKLWPSCCSYVINGSWAQFCKKRHLRSNDEIGLRWDTQHRQFHISVLKRVKAPRTTKIRRLF